VAFKTYEALKVAAESGCSVSFVETAGGVLSPAPSGKSQADVFRPLRLPIFLVGDHKLGGIATTISAYESLKLRGYDVIGLATFKDDHFKNHEYLAEYFQARNLSTLSLDQPPARQVDIEADQEALGQYYDEVSSGSVKGFLEEAILAEQNRIERLEQMDKEATSCIWYPFTQHQKLKSKDIMVIDSAYGDNFDILIKDSAAKNGPLLQPSFDGSASWWTQGFGHGNPDLSLAAAYAAGRYGHVMFAGAVNEPALALAQKLLRLHNNPKLSRVFYSDNGSTGMEVAIKMALRASSSRYGWRDDKKEEIKILGLKGSYHGDTMGVMDSSEPSAYNDRVEWYKARGGKYITTAKYILTILEWLDYPTVKMVQGRWALELPGDFDGISSDGVDFQSLDHIFDPDRINSKLYSSYCDQIKQKLKAISESGTRLGGLIIEPVILGAGGMNFADPLYQRALVNTVRSSPELISGQPELQSSSSTDLNSSPGWSGLPIVFDEVFTGIFRLGRFNCNTFLHCTPDIVVNAKLLTGGLIPLCTTMASEEVFNAFLADSKADALLHGHSYTAHAMGCQIGVETLKTLEPRCQQGSQDLSVWSSEFLEATTVTPGVQEAWALGTVLAIRFKDEDGGMCFIISLIR
jgi:dethiobiotin synthetase/adenosylmethionine--8-amino-7-oxononanoate aminotransferase